MGKTTRATRYTRDDILQSECDVCKAERASKARVATDANDPRFSSEKFSKAIAIFAHNDVKYDTNKTRAKLFAARQSEGIVYSVAKDTPSQDALRERPGLQTEKIKWLQRHDRECGDLYGCLPLIHGMPVATTDHIDRSPDKAILRGRIGYVDSWVLHAEEESSWDNGVRCLHNLPPAVFVKYPGATWVLPGLSEPGLYPITPRISKWYLDSGRNYPMLRISRRQLPLAPAFAMTAYACQGTTLPAAIVDMQSGRGS